MIQRGAYSAYVGISAVIGVVLALVSVLTQRPPAPLPVFLFSAVIFALLALVVLAVLTPWVVRWSQMSTPRAALVFGTILAVAISLTVFWRITDGLDFVAASDQRDYSTPPLLACVGTWIVATPLAFLVLTFWRRRRS